MFLPNRFLERAIGVIYRPETERLSHYFYADLPYQFDGIIHFDTTRAVEPLDKRRVGRTTMRPKHFPKEFNKLEEKIMDNKYNLQTEEPENPFKDPNEPTTPEPTIPDPSPEKPNPYPVTDPIPEPNPEPFPVPPEPIPKLPPDVVF